MSNWGAIPDWEFALAFDQESGIQIDQMLWNAQPFAQPLVLAQADGKLPRQRLWDMVRRIPRPLSLMTIQLLASATTEGSPSRSTPP